jgi:hypothetical protein
VVGCLGFTAVTLFSHLLFFTDTWIVLRVAHSAHTYILGYTR